MNIQVHETNREHPKTVRQALELAELTRELSNCCLDKETKMCRSFGINSADGRVIASMLREKLTTSSAIAQQLGIGNSRITPLIDRLVKKGMVVRTECDDDRRVRRLELTSEGREVARNLMAFEASLHRRLLEHFPERERERLLSTLKSLRGAMNEIRQSIDKQTDSEFQL